MVSRSWPEVLDLITNETSEHSFLHGFMSGEGLDGMTDADLFDDFCLV